MPEELLFPAELLFPELLPADVLLPAEADACFVSSCAFFANCSSAFLWASSSCFFCAARAASSCAFTVARSVEVSSAFACSAACSLSSWLCRSSSSCCLLFSSASCSSIPSRTFTIFSSISLSYFVIFWIKSTRFRNSPILFASHTIESSVPEPFSYMYLIRVFMFAYCTSSLLREIWSDASKRNTSLLDSSIFTSVSAISLLIVTRSWLIPSN